MGEKVKATRHKNIHYKDPGVHKWESNILKSLKEMQHKGVDWI
jgi:SNF2 family DNA or RNA helicase